MHAMAWLPLLRRRGPIWKTTTEDSEHWQEALRSVDERQQLPALQAEVAADAEIRVGMRQGEELPS
jgi:hypothetical protein